MVKSFDFSNIYGWAISSDDLTNWMLWGVRIPFDLYFLLKHFFFDF